MDLDELITFATVARVGAITRAAGEQLLPYASKISSLVDEARRAVGDRTTPHGPLRIGSLESTAGHRLAPVLAHYGADHPQVDISLVTGTSAELIEDVLAHRLEGALVAGPVSHAELDVEPIITEELVVVSAPSWPGPDVLTTEAREVKILVLRVGCSYRAMLERLLAARGIVAVSRLEFGTLDVILSCAGAGMGITLLPRIVVEAACRRGEVAVHALPAEEAHAVTVFIRRRDAFVSAALARFVEHCRALTSVAAEARPRQGRPNTATITR